MISLVNILLISLVAHVTTVARPSVGKSGFFTTSDGVQIHYQQAGEGPSLVFVPGWTMPGWIWEAQIHYFSQRYRVVALDPRSQGESEKPTEGHYFKRRGQDIKELTEHLKLSPTILVGWSMGAREVLAAVDQQPTGWVRAVVLVDEIFGYEPNAKTNLSQFGKNILNLQTNRKKVTELFVRGMYKKPQSEEYLQRIMAASLKTPTNTAVTLSASYAAVGDWRTTLAKIHVPLLYVATAAQKSQAVGLQADKPLARVVVFEEAGHALFVDEPERFNTLLEEFLKQAGLSSNKQQL